MIDPSMVTADGPGAPAPMEPGQLNAVQALAEMLGVAEMQYQQVQQVASLAVQALQSFMDPGLVTADGPVGPEPMMPEEGMGMEEGMEMPEEEMDPEMVGEEPVF